MGGIQIRVLSKMIFEALVDLVLVGGGHTMLLFCNACTVYVDRFED